ncbi:MAG: PHP domain-containing protein, partial [Pseudomonadota bacterium]
MRRGTVFTIALLLLNGLAAAAAQVRHEIQFPDLPGYQTLKCDLHTHTVFSDGLVWPDVRVYEAWREGLDAIAITDHIEYQPHKQDVPTNHNRPYELAANPAKERDILLIKGAEITRDTPPGHHNAIFLSDIEPLATDDFYAVFEQAHQQQAFIFWNHPSWKGRELGRWGEHQTTLLEKQQLPGIEICNGGAYYAQAHQYAVERKLTMLGNSDI